ncbi:hypothetical protein SCALM49S_03114 [Streptomyces californicus]
MDDGGRPGHRPRVRRAGRPLRRPRRGRTPADDPALERYRDRHRAARRAGRTPDHAAGGRDVPHARHRGRGGRRADDAGAVRAWSRPCGPARPRTQPRSARAARTPSRSTSASTPPSPPRAPAEDARETAHRAARRGWDRVFAANEAAWREDWSADVLVPGHGELQGVAARRPVRTTGEHPARRRRQHRPGRSDQRQLRGNGLLGRGDVDVPGAAGDPPGAGPFGRRVPLPHPGRGPRERREARVRRAVLPVAEREPGPPRLRVPELGPAALVLRRTTSRETSRWPSGSTFWPPATATGWGSGAGRC